MKVFSVRADEKVKAGLVSFCRIGSISLSMLLEDVYRMLEDGELAVYERHLTYGREYREFVKTAEEKGMEPSRILENVTAQMKGKK